MSKENKNKTTNEYNSSHREMLVGVRKIITKSSIRCLSSEIRYMENGNYSKNNGGKYWSEWYGKDCSIEFMKGLLSGVRKCDDNINTIIGFGDTISSMEDKCDGKD